jgi:hypothetical protein
MNNNKGFSLTDGLAIKDIMNISELHDRLNAKPKKTRITFRDADTGEVKGVFENKIVISGSLLNALQSFGVKNPGTIPTYNEEMKLDGSVAPGTTPENIPIVCLFGVSDSGCGTNPTDVVVANYTDRIEPYKDGAATSDMLMPFRYVDKANDLSDTLRKYYFGRKELSGNKVGYFFKRFDTEPQLHLQYADGTAITDDLYKIKSDQIAECYIETRLRITRLDFRDYLEQVLGWDKGRMSTLSLYWAWYTEDENGIKTYQDITTYSKLNFSYKWLVDLTTAFDINYQIYY